MKQILTSEGFGSRLGQHINMFSTTYGFGMQGSNLYIRTAAGFRIYLAGVHSDTAGAPGAGGSELFNVTNTSAQFKSNNLATELWTQSRGVNLVTNGTGLLQNNTNFSQFTYDGVENFAGSGSFIYDGVDAAKQTDELIAVNPFSRYKLSYAIRLVSKSQAGETPNHYGYVEAFDADRSTISPYHVLKVAGSTLTTLAADLNPGNLTITLTDATGWYNGSSSTFNILGVFPYTNAQGYTYPDYTYTRLTYLDQWPASGITGNVITLKVPWAGPAYVAGTKVANMQSGGTYDYIAGSNVATPTSWTIFEGTIGKWDSDANLSVTSPVVSNGAYMHASGFRWGTAFIRVGWLLSYNTAVGTARSAIDAVSFNEIDHTFRAAQGTPPFAVTSTTVVPNLNADLFDGLHSSAIVLKGGDTMTGPLVLPADPTLALQAATKQYVDAHDGVNVQVFTSSGTWTKPTNIKMVTMYAIAGGAGGGAGRRGAVSTVRQGGGGGGGGGFSQATYTAADLAAVTTLTVTVGVGSAGGIATATDDTDGANGTNGVASKVTLSGNPTFVRTSGGQSGPGGKATGTPAGGLAGNGTFSGGAGGAASSTGDVGSQSFGGFSVAGVGNIGYPGALGGGAGGGILATNVVSNGATCSARYDIGETAVSGGSAGAAGADATTGTNLGLPTSPTSPIPGQGGGGGASSITAAAGKGGAGIYGGGGGGGGASLNGNASGAGGKGGDGLVVIVTTLG